MRRDCEFVFASNRPACSRLGIAQPLNARQHPDMTTQDRIAVGGDFAGWLLRLDRSFGRRTNWRLGVFAIGSDDRGSFEVADISPARTLQTARRPCAANAFDRAHNWRHQAKSVQTSDLGPS